MKTKDLLEIIFNSLIAGIDPGSSEYNKARIMYRKYLNKIS